MTDRNTVRDNYTAKRRVNAAERLYETQTKLLVYLLRAWLMSAQTLLRGLQVFYWDKEVLGDAKALIPQLMRQLGAARVLLDLLPNLPDGPESNVLGYQYRASGTDAEVMAEVVKEVANG